LHIDICLTLLLGFMLVAALVAVEVKDLLASVIAAGVVSLAAAVAFLLLGAPDLALVQVAGPTVLLVVLVRGTGVREEDSKPGAQGNLATAVGIAVVCVLLIACSWVYTRREAGRGLPTLGNPVALRPYDTPDDASKRLAARREAKPWAGREERGVSRLYLDESWRALKARDNRRENKLNRDKEDYILKDATFEPQGGQVHLGNRVTAAFLGYRAYDALAAAAAALAALVGVLVVTRKRRSSGEQL
jgi:multisubunit Na+/H+ antiporter MnhB subunit